MAWVNNGTSRSLKFTVNKSVGGNQVQGYPKTYDGQQAFPGYATLTDTEARQLSDAEFTTRYNALVAYVESLEAGLDVATDTVGDGATKSDPSCVITTTTTEAPVETTTTTQGAPKLRVDYYDANGIYTGNVSDTQILNMLSVGNGSSYTVYSVSVSTVNTGNANLTVSAVTELEDTEGLFSITSSGLPWSVPATFQNGFTVEFNAAAADVTPGTYRGVFQITSNDPSYPDFSFELIITIV